MITQEEWAERVERVAQQLNDLSVLDAVMVMTTMLTKLIYTAPPDMQHILSMKVAQIMIGQTPEPPELH